MRVAIFSDVHGNLIALERFLQCTQDLVDSYICLGDMVNYGPWNDECLELINKLPNISVVQGNHERIFLGVEGVEHQLPLVRSFFHHSIQFFSRKDLITNLPSSTDLGPFRCVHTVNGRSIYPDSTIHIDGNFIIGHSHHQFLMRRDGCTIVNPGSVGQNRKWIDMVDYAVMETATGIINMNSVDYDIDRFLSELRQRNYPKECIDYYLDKPRKNKG